MPESFNRLKTQTAHGDVCSCKESSNPATKTICAQVPCTVASSIQACVNITVRGPASVSRAMSMIRAAKSASLEQSAVMEPASTTPKPVSNPKSPKGHSASLIISYHAVAVLLVCRLHTERSGTAKKHINAVIISVLVGETPASTIQRLRIPPWIQRKRIRRKKRRSLSPKSPKTQTKNLRNN